MEKPPYVVVLETIIKALVNYPESVNITRELDELGVLLKVKVHPQDMGLLIGKKGAMVQAIKTIMKAIGLKNHARLNIKIEEPNQLEKARAKITADKIIEELKK